MGVAAKVTVDWPAEADEEAVTVAVTAVPGVALIVEGLIVTPVGSPVTVTAVAPAADDPARSREICCPVAPAVRLRLAGVKVSE